MAYTNDSGVYSPVPAMPAMPWEHQQDYNAMVLQISEEQNVRRSLTNPACNFKTKMCNSIVTKNYCPFQDKCTYAHSVDELRVPVHVPISFLRRVVNPKYKTKPCNKFHVFGSCPYGDRCHFIHHDVYFPPDVRTLHQACPSFPVSPPSTPPHDHGHLDHSSPDNISAIGEERQGHAYAVAVEDIKRLLYLLQLQ